jgi:hypothetical protein
LHVIVPQSAQSAGQHVGPVDRLAHASPTPQSVLVWHGLVHVVDGGFADMPPGHAENVQASGSNSQRPVHCAHIAGQHLRPSLRFPHISPGPQSASDAHGAMHFGPQSPGHVAAVSISHTSHLPSPQNGAAGAGIGGGIGAIVPPVGVAAGTAAVTPPVIDAVPLLPPSSPQPPTAAVAAQPHATIAVTRIPIGPRRSIEQSRVPWGALDLAFARRA